MKIEDLKNIRTMEDIRNFAIDWQYWVSEQNLSYEELNKWQTVFIDLADEYTELLEEFKENGII
jgi:hypothetical protein